MKTSLIRELCIPISLLGILASMVFPLPPMLLDILLTVNLVFALALFITTLHISEPLKLSSLPTILLLATLFRLCLNISTTRLILSGGDVGDSVRAFGTFVVQGNLAVGAIIFIVITLIQFMVIAKGAERVAEVSARFALDAMPGKQMSIDADVRAGLFDSETARLKRQEVQTESRFYGALDGAMKFVKGDAIAGILIVLINVIGGFILGIAVYKLSLSQSISKYTLLSIGDGLLAQIPSLLNSLAAGLVVTRVPSAKKNSVSFEMLQQLSQSRMVCVLVGVFTCFIGIFPGMPKIPLFLVGSTIIIIGWLQVNSQVDHRNSKHQFFIPKFRPVITLKGSPEVFNLIGSSEDLMEILELIRENVYQRTGLIVPRPEIDITHANSHLELIIRDFSRAKIHTIESKEEIIKVLAEKIIQHRIDLLDDIHSRRILDFAESAYPELVSNIIPQLLTLTQFTELMKHLSRDGITLRPLDVILQAIAESAAKTQNERQLLEEVRVALGPWIIESVSHSKTLRVLLVDSAIDLSLIQAEKGKGIVPTDYIKEILEATTKLADQIDCIVVSKGARRLLSEYMPSVKTKILAFEEIPEDVELVKVSEVFLNHEKQLCLIEKLAA